MADDTITDGKIVTFYSYKGGTGRTMALANVAWILASNGKRVLVVDWDLESPGLHRFFHPFLDAARSAATPGVIDLISEYAWDATEAGGPARRLASGTTPRSSRTPSRSTGAFPGGGTLDFVSAGRQNRDYSVAG